MNETEFEKKGRGVVTGPHMSAVVRVPHQRRGTNVHQLGRKIRSNRITTDDVFEDFHVGRMNTDFRQGTVQ